MTEIQFEQIERRYGQLRVVEIGLIGLLITIGGFLILRLPELPIQLPLYVSTAVLAVSALVACAFGFTEARRRAFAIEPARVHVRQGLFNQKLKVVPRSRIQHVEVVRGPGERIFGLSKLILFTASSRGADIIISGLDPDKAKEIRADLLERKHGDE